MEHEPKNGSPTEQEESFRPATGRRESEPPGQAGHEHTRPRPTPMGASREDGRRTEFELDHGAVVIAAITSCTNTSNPSVMLGAGLLAKKAVERGLSAGRG